MRRATSTLTAAALTALVGLGVLAASAPAATTPDLKALFAAGSGSSPGSPCPAYSSDSGNVTNDPSSKDDRICTAEVPSFDGSKLDVDVTLPKNDNGSGRHPLIVLLHGFGNNKHEFESRDDTGDDRDKYHWNNHWFAEHGYYVINYTARGFRDDGPYDDYQPNTPGTPFTSVDLTPPAMSGTLHVKSRDFEIKDTQYLAALTAKAFPDLDPNRVAVSGTSYGGGESWTQASQGPNWTWPHEKMDPALPAMKLQVAVPHWPWTDLAYALAPNGHPGGPSGTDIYESSQGRIDVEGQDNNAGEGYPIGNPKFSYVNGLFALGNEKGVFEQGQTTDPGPEGPVNIPAGNARLVEQGDPYDVAGVEDQLVKQYRRGFTEFRSSYYQDEGWLAQQNGPKTAIFAIQGWTDDLFPAVEAFRQFKYLKRLDPRWPVEVRVADIGHSRAQNKPATWHRLNPQAWGFLQSNIDDNSHERETTVASEPTICANDGDPANNDNAASQLTAKTPEGLGNGTLSVQYSRSGNTTNPLGVSDLNGESTDAIFGSASDSLRGISGPCRSAATQTASGGYTAYSQPLPSATTYIGLGFAKVAYQLAGANTATLNARVFDVPPGAEADPSRQLLMTRGTYRIDAPKYDTLAGTIRLPLYGNHWPLAPGHKIRLDLTQVDAPTYRPSNEASSLTFGPPTLTLPTRKSGDQTLGGG